MKRILFLILVLIVQKELAARLPDLIPYRTKNGLWGYCDSTKKIIIPCKFDAVKPFGNSDSARGVFEGKNVWIKKNGDFYVAPKPSPDSVLPGINKPSYHYVFMGQGVPYYLYSDSGGIYTHEHSWFSVPYIPDPQSNLFPVQNARTKRYGYKNQKGKIVIPCRFSDAGYFSEGLAAVVRNNEMQYINAKGKVMMQFKDYAALGSHFDSGHAIVFLKSGYGLVNKNGDFIIKPFNFRITDEGNFYIVWQSAPGSPIKLVLFDKTGKQLDPRSFDRLEKQENGYWMAEHDGHSGFLNETGKEIIPLKYSFVLTFSEHLCGVADFNNHWGYINEKGEEVIPLKYGGANSFSSGYALVRDTTADRFFGIVNTKGIEILPCQFPGALNFRNGYAAVASKEGNWGFINEKGELVLPFKFSQPVDGFDEHGLCIILYRGNLETRYIDIHGTMYWEN